MRVKRLTRCALLTAIALAIFVLEAQIPIPFPVPGMKLGLSNIITLFALFSFGWKDALAIVVIRILLGNLASGQVMALLYSLGGRPSELCRDGAAAPHCDGKRRSGSQAWPEDFCTIWARWPWRLP